LIKDKTLKDFKSFRVFSFSDKNYLSRQFRDFMVGAEIEKLQKMS